MIRHYIKTAFRNLLKYKAQNIIYSADAEERKKKAAKIEQQKEQKYQKDLQVQQDLLTQMENFRESSDEYEERG